MKDYSGHFCALIEQKLPDDSRIVSPRSGPDMVFLATWRLMTDPVRPRMQDFPVGDRPIS